MSGIKCRLVNRKVLSHSVHSKTTSDTIVATAGCHHQVDGKFMGMISATTGHLIETVAVDVSIAIGIVAN